MALDANKRRAIEFLAAGYTQAETAEQIGVQRQTVNGWVNKDEEFAAEYDAVLKAQSQVFVRDMRSAASRVSLRWQTLIDSDDEGIALRALLAWVEKFGALNEQKVEVAPTDVSEAVEFLKWRAQQTAPKAQSGDDDAGQGDKSP